MDSFLNIFLLLGEAMENKSLDFRIENSKEGNELERQLLINSNKAFIINTISHICRRFITWSDEEASIGLLAFNHAIDTFDASKGKTFHSYSYFLINHALINYFKKNRNNLQTLSLDYNDEEDSSITAEEMDKSIQEYNNKIASRELIEEISELDHELKEYRIEFEELEKCSPKHKDTKEMVAKMVDDFLTHSDLVGEFTINKRFPATAFSQKTLHPLKTIEKHKKYLITMIVIKMHPEWTFLSGYLK